MKLTILGNSRGGVFSYTVALVRGLSSRECKVDVYLLEKSEIARQLLCTLGIEPKSLTFSRLLPDIRSVLKFLMSDRPQVVHTNFAILGCLAVFKKYVFKIPFIYTAHGVPQPWLESSFVKKVEYTLEKRLLPFVVSRAFATIAISEYVRNQLKTTYGLSSEVIYNGIEVYEFRQLDRETSRKRLRYDEEDIIGLCIAKLHPYKDPLTLIDALGKVVQSNKNLHIVLIGSGELRRQVDQKISTLNLSERIRIVEHVTDEELKMYYGAADFFVLTSTNEAFGMVLLEAMASSLPIIASDSGACPEVVNGVGILFAQGDSTDLANKISILSCDRELRMRLARAGYARVREKFSLENMISQYWKLYKRTLVQVFVTY